MRPEVSGKDIHVERLDLFGRHRAPRNNRVAVARGGQLLGAFKLAVHKLECAAGVIACGDVEPTAIRHMRIDTVGDVGGRIRIGPEVFDQHLAGTCVLPVQQ